MAYYHDLNGKKGGSKARGTGDYGREEWSSEGRESSRGSRASGEGRKDRYERSGSAGRGSRGEGFRAKSGDRNPRYENSRGNDRDSRRGDSRSRNGDRGSRYEGSRSRGNDRPRFEENRPRRNERPGSDFAPSPREREPKGYQDFEYRKPAETFRPEPEVDDHILCGRNPIREALRSSREIEKLLVQKGELSGSAREIVREAREKKIMVQEVDKRRLDEILPHHQGLIAFASAYHYADVEDMLAEAESKGEAPFLILLDGVTDPHNLGAVIRTAECVGAHGVIIPLHRSVGLTPAAVKASAGAVEHMKVARVTNLNRTIDDLKRLGIWTYAVTMDGKDYEKVDFRGGTALVIGAEGEGISRLTAEKCDLSVSLPMRGALDSLNASVAAGVMMYRVLASRRKG